MAKFDAFANSTWNAVQMDKWWKLHQDDNAPRCGILRTKALTELLSPVILEREVM